MNKRKDLYDLTSELKNEEKRTKGKFDVFLSILRTFVLAGGCFFVCVFVVNLKQARAITGKDVVERTATCQSLNPINSISNSSSLQLNAMNARIIPNGFKGSSLPNIQFHNEVRVIFKEDPPPLTSKYRVLHKDSSFQAPFATPLPMPRPTKKGAIRASTSDSDQNKNISEEKIKKAKIQKFYNQLVRNAVVYPLYYSVVMNTPRLIGLLYPLLQKTAIKNMPQIKKNLIEGMRQTLPQVKTDVTTADIQTGIQTGIKNTVSNLSNIESGVNLLKQVNEKPTNTSEKEKSNMIIDLFKETQSARLNDIENDPVLKDTVRQASKDDFIAFVSGGEGTIYRLKALKYICRRQEIDSFRSCCKKGIIYPIRNFALASAYLSDWYPDPNYQLKTGGDLFTQGVLEKTSSVVQQESRALQIIMITEESSLKQEPHFVTFSLLGLSINHLSERINIAKKTVSPKDMAFWTNKSKLLISDSLLEAAKELHESGFCGDHVDSSLGQLRQQYLED